MYQSQKEYNKSGPKVYRGYTKKGQTKREPTAQENQPSQKNQLYLQQRPVSIPHYTRWTKTKSYRLGYVLEMPFFLITMDEQVSLLAPRLIPWDLGVTSQVNPTVPPRGLESITIGQPLFLPQRFTSTELPLVG